MAVCECPIFTLRCAADCLLLQRKLKKIGFCLIFFRFLCNFLAMACVKLTKKLAKAL